MGNLCGPSARYNPDDQATEVDKVLQMHLQHQREDDQRKVKLLLLGAGESGKSTLFKQIKLNYLNEFARTSMIDEREPIIRAFFLSFGRLLKAIIDTHKTLGNDDLDEMMIALYPRQPKRNKKRTLEPNVVRFMHDVWNSAVAQEIWENKNKYQLTDSLGYFCESVDRMAHASYCPTEEDYLRCRISTVGINEQTFSYRQVKMVVVDVGGQRSERKKWIQCFDQVNAVLFVAAISEFGQVLFEDDKVDRLGEAIELFHKTLNFRVFRNTPIMLFLNKHDLFVEKMQKLERNNENLDQYFPELNLGTNYNGADEKILDHLKMKFKTGALNPDRINFHLSTALDRNKFKTVFTGMAQIILTKAMDTHFEQV